MSLDEKDKNWIAAELAKVRTDMATGLAEVRTDMATGFAEVRTDMAAGLAEVRTDMAAGLAEVRLDLERVETSLLTEFHKWASPMEMRVKSHSLALRAFDLEVESLSERVEKLEPPH